MNSTFSSFLPSATLLGTVALFALYLTLARGWADESPRDLRRAVRTALLAVVVQAAHFGEELATGFHEAFPALLGLDPIPLLLFVGFNVAWLIVWIVSTWGLAGHHRAALFPLWFLGLGDVLNGLAHPLLSILARGYFPGIVTAPVAGGLGALLLVRLSRITKPR